jgi:hypothetical protein
MYLRHHRLLVKITLEFFVTMVIYNPVYAAQISPYVQQGTLSNTRIPVSQVTQEQADEIIREAHRRGYRVQEATMQQLAELKQTDKKLEQKAQQSDKKDTKAKKQPCSKSNTDDQAKAQEAAKENRTKEEQVNKGLDQKKEEDCIKEEENKNKQKSSETGEPMAVPFPNPQPAPAPVPQPAPPPPPPPPAQPTVQTNIGVEANVGYSDGGGSGDSGKVFFIIAGVVVIAAFVIYAGKYIVDIATGKDVKLWWEFLFSNTYLDTRSGQHGWLNGLKIATGFVSSDLIQVALVGELGKTSVDVILDENSAPVPLDYTATYWMVGASARLHLTDKLVNASYLFLDFMGGKTSQGSADTIGMARLGASFGINNNTRLGVNIGAHYIGLKENQGFVNHGDNYWTTLGFEMGVRF